MICHSIAFAHFTFAKWAQQFKLQLYLTALILCSPKLSVRHHFILTCQKRIWQSRLSTENQFINLKRRHGSATLCKERGGVADKHKQLMLQVAQCRASRGCATLQIGCPSWSWWWWGQTRPSLDPKFCLPVATWQIKHLWSLSLMLLRASYPVEFRCCHQITRQQKLYTKESWDGLERRRPKCSPCQKACNTWGLALGSP